MVELFPAVKMNSKQLDLYIRVCVRTYNTHKLGSENNIEMKCRAAKRSIEKQTEKEIEREREGSAGGGAAQDFVNE